MKLFEIYNLFESFPIAKQTFVDQGGDLSEVSNYIAKFRDITQRKVVPEEHAKDIVEWTKLGWEQFKKHVDYWEHAPTNTELKKVDEPKPDESIFIHETDSWLFVIPLSANASCFHGRKSNWCTTKRDHSHFSDYFLNYNVTLIYCLHKDVSERDIDGMYAIAYYPNSGRYELFDKYDKAIDDDTFMKGTGIDHGDIIGLAKKQGHIVDKGRESFRRNDPMMLVDRAIDEGKPIPAYENIIARHPKAAFMYAQAFFEGKGWPMGEKAIARSPRMSFRYAHDVLDEPFLAGEPAILRDPVETVNYAFRVLHGRWPAAEKMLVNYLPFAKQYASQFEHDFSDNEMHNFRIQSKNNYLNYLKTPIIRKAAAEIASTVNKHTYDDEYELESFIDTYVADYDKLAATSLLDVIHDIDPMLVYALYQNGALRSPRNLTHFKEDYYNEFLNWYESMY